MYAVGYPMPLDASTLQLRMLASFSKRSRRKKERRRKKRFDVALARPRCPPLGVFSLPFIFISIFLCVRALSPANLVKWEHVQGTFAL